MQERFRDQTPEAHDKRQVSGCSKKSWGCNKKRFKWRLGLLLTSSIILLKLFLVMSYG